MTDQLDSLAASAPWASGPLAASRRLRAASMRERGRAKWATAAKSAIITSPPTNSAAANCQPISTATTMPSSITRLVEASMKAIAVTKPAPSVNSDLVMAAAA